MAGAPEGAGHGVRLSGDRRNLAGDAGQGRLPALEAFLGFGSGASDSALDVLFDGAEAFARFADRAHPARQFAGYIRGSRADFRELLEHPPELAADAAFQDQGQANLICFGHWNAPISSAL